MHSNCKMSSKIHKKVQRKHCESLWSCLKAGPRDIHNCVRSRGRFCCLVIHFCPDTPGPASSRHPPKGFPKRWSGCPDATGQLNKPTRKMDPPAQVLRRAGNGRNRKRYSRSAVDPTYNWPDFNRSMYIHSGIVTSQRNESVNNPLPLDKTFDRLRSCSGPFRREKVYLFRELLAIGHE